MRFGDEALTGAPEASCDFFLAGAKDHGLNLVAGAKVGIVEGGGGRLNPGLTKGGGFGLSIGFVDITMLLGVAGLTGEDTGLATWDCLPGREPF